MAKFKVSIGIIIIIISITLGIYFNYYSEGKLAGNVVDDITPARDIEFFFYDTKTNCTINGEVYVGDHLLGSTEEGSLWITEKEYQNNFYETAKVSIIGATDNCFGKDSNLPFKEVWNIPDLEYYLENDEPLLLELELNPRWPYYPEEMQGFVRPEEVAEKLSSMNINENYSQLESIEKIFGKVYMNWVSDSGRFGLMEYWQTPSEFIKNKGGDCEDWAVYFLSLLRKHDPDLNCYAAVWHTHVNVLCHIDKKFIILDQDKVRKNLVLDEEESLQDNQIEARKWRNDYFKEYGIESDERILYYLFNEEEYIEFENGQEDFISWILETAGI